VRPVSLLAALAAAAVLLVACGDDEDPAEEETVGVLVGTEQRVRLSAEARAVLAGIVNRAIDDPSFSSSGYLTDPQISQSFLDQLAALEAANAKAGFPGRDFDPFVCAQQLPTDVSFADAGGAGDRHTFIGRLKFGPATEKVTYVMTFATSEWQLDSTGCLDAAQPKGE
jgi:hypothetical protein